MRKRNPWLCGNWKMNFTRDEMRVFLGGIESLKESPHANMSLFTPYLHLESAKNTLNPLGLGWIQVGAQNAHSEKKGAFTGEISGPMLKDLNIQQVLIGHSERRQYFNETDASVLKKCESLIEQGFQVLVCIGETLAERNEGKTSEVLNRQTELLFQSEKLSPFWGSKINIAYEPVWAIGTGITATPEQAHEAHLTIRKLLAEKQSTETAQKTLILYGGSVTPENFKDLLKSEEIDGGLVGGASLKADSWCALWSALC